MSSVANTHKPSNNNSEEKKDKTITGEHSEPNERSAQLKARYSTAPQNKHKTPAKSTSSPMKH